MKLSTLMYHDVVASFDRDCSGFEGEDASRYKITEEMFSQHLDTLARNLVNPPTLFQDVHFSGVPEGGAWALTFDDGGAAALRIADMLEMRKWWGHFFVTTDHVDKKFFLNRNQIRQLRERGHVIGSHSRSHPKRMADQGPVRLLDEWRGSVMAIEDILGERVVVASVPGGYYDKSVAEAAALAGITCLFNSRPTRSSYFEGNCRIVGRYAVMRTTSPRAALALASGDSVRCGLRRFLWELKNVARRAGGAHYETLRDVFVRRHLGSR